jgi:hypothetical protein
LSGEEISDELRKVEDTHLQEDTTDKVNIHMNNNANKF